MEFLELAIVGAIVSLLVQGVKKYFGTSEYWTLAVVVALSLLTGWVYFFWQGTMWWEQFVQVLVYSGAVYTFLIKRF